MSNFIEIKNEYLSISINTLGAELSTITGRGGTEFLWNGDKNVWSGKAPVLFPICGGLKGGKYTYKSALKKLSSLFLLCHNHRAFVSGHSLRVSVAIISIIPF